MDTSAPPILNIRGSVGEHPSVRTREQEDVQENFGGRLGAVHRMFRRGGPEGRNRTKFASTLIPS